MINDIISSLNPEERQRLMMSSLSGGAAAIAPLLGPQKARVGIGQILAAFGAGIGGAREQTLGNIESGRMREEESKLRRTQIEMQTKEAEDQAAERAQRAAWIAQQPPEMQRMLETFQYGGAEAGKRMFPEPPDPNDMIRNVGNDVVQVQPDGTVKKIYSAPFTPQSPRQDPLVEVYDANSPTGTVLIPSSQAAGRSGKPPSGMEVSYDENGRPVVRTGVRGGERGEVGKPPTGFRVDATGEGLEPIPGGPGEALPAEVAGRLALLPGALEDLNSVRGMVMNPDGSVNRWPINSANVPLIGEIPFTQGRDLKAKILGTADTIQRIKTGAGMNEKEIENAEKTYFPSPLDNAETVKNKLDRLERDIRSAAESISRGRGGVDLPGDKDAKPAAPAVGEVKGGYRFKGGDPADPTSWEPAGG